jgi:hypothetical protein
MAIVILAAGELRLGAVGIVILAVGGGLQLLRAARKR